MRRVAVMEPCPRELAHLERPRYGGHVFFSDEGVGGCQHCGWRGVPTVTDGVISSWCPGCQRDPDLPADEALVGGLRSTVLLDQRVRLAKLRRRRRERPSDDQTRMADPRRVSRNASCPCGSGAKAKRCGCEAFTV